MQITKLINQLKSRDRSTYLFKYFTKLQILGIKISVFFFVIRMNYCGLLPGFIVLPMI